MANCDCERCYSPIACSAFGYCRERNIKHGMPDQKTIKAWKQDYKAPSNPPNQE